MQNHQLHQQNQQMQNIGQQDVIQMNPSQDLQGLRSEFEQYQRFQLDLEFINMLANPYYILKLQEYDYFSNERFRNYLKYLSYFKQPEYFKFIKYPLCIKMLDLIQLDKFLENLTNRGEAFANVLNEQNSFHKLFLNHLSQNTHFNQDIKKENN